MPAVVGMQLLKGGKTTYYRAPEQSLALESMFVVETDHGLQVARLVRARMDWPECPTAAALPRIVRPASARDLDQVKQNERREQDAYRFCRERVAERELSMKLVDVSYTLDGRKAVFFFTAENRVDFRELVKDLAHRLRIKIEMRQIGVRDEARRLGGVGCCGRTLCCCNFLKDFVSVSIRMAKDQNLSLNPTKVSGLCGRLMCCLAYEHDPTAARRKKEKPEPAAAAGPTAPPPAPSESDLSVAAAPGPSATRPPEGSAPKRRKRRRHRGRPKTGAGPDAKPGPEGPRAS